LFSTLCLVATGTLVAGVNAAQTRPVPVCDGPGCSIAEPALANGLTSPAHLQAVASVMCKKKI